VSCALGHENRYALDSEFSAGADLLHPIFWAGGLVLKDQGPPRGTQSRWRGGGLEKPVAWFGRWREACASTKFCSTTGRRGWLSSPERWPGWGPAETGRPACKKTCRFDPWRTPVGRMKSTFSVWTLFRSPTIVSLVHQKLAYIQL